MTKWWCSGDAHSVALNLVICSKNSKDNLSISLLFWVHLCHFFVGCSYPQTSEFYLSPNFAGEDFSFRPKKGQKFFPDREGMPGRCNATLGGVERSGISYSWLLLSKLVDRCFSSGHTCKNPPA